MTVYCKVNSKFVNFSFCVCCPATLPTPSPMIVSECLTTGLLLLILGVIHTNVSCSECKKQSIEGIRWECSDCVNFNLCSSCYMNEKHALDHVFNRIEARGKPG